MRKVHIVFKKNEEDFFSTGKTYESTWVITDKESDHIQNILLQWEAEFIDYPKKQFMILYPII